VKRPVVFLLNDLLLLEISNQQGSIAEEVEDYHELQEK
jgi:hypothetical protein